MRKLCAIPDECVTKACCDRSGAVMLVGALQFKNALLDKVYKTGFTYIAYLTLSATCSSDELAVLRHTADTDSRWPPGFKRATTRRTL
jgi:hypothetical protein